MSDFVSDLVGPSEQGTPPLTIEVMQSALDKMTEQYYQEAVRRANALADFCESVPVYLHSHPLVREMAYYVATDTPMHPKKYEEYRRRYEALLSE